MCFIFNTAFAARAREQFGERTSLLEILRPSPLFKVQKLTINVTKPSYPFPTVVPQHSEDQVGVITKLLLLSIKRRKVKTMYKKKKNLKSSPILAMLHEKHARQVRQPVAPREMGTVHFPGMCAGENAAGDIPSEGKEKKRLTSTFPLCTARMNKSALEGNVSSSFITRRQ